MCNSSTITWKREIVPDHKFDFVDTREFSDHGCGMRTKYMWLYILILKDFLVYVSDIFTAITMLTTSTWSNEIFDSCPKTRDGCVAVPFNVGKWLFVGCIIFSFLLLAYEGHKAKKIIASRDISYAFTNIMANNYYSLRSYDHFCFFDHISNSTKRADDFAFFVFFTFKSWKRVILADGPRQSINALTLYSFYLVKETKGPWYDVSKYFEGNASIVTSALTVSTLFTVIIFAGSLILLIVAGLCYVPLLCHIQGNLKEYCCHKVDKRISEIIVRRNRQRMVKAAEQAKKEAAGDYSHLKNKKGELVAKPLPQPTLPNLSVEDDMDDGASMRTRGPPPSNYTAQSDFYYSEHKQGYASDYPPMPAYNQPYSHHQAGGYSNYNHSVPNVYDENQLYDDETGSTAHLALGAAPFAQNHDPHGSYGGYSADPHDVYYGQHQSQVDYDPHAQQHYGQAGDHYGQPTDHFEPDRAASRTPAPQYEASPSMPPVDPYAKSRQEYQPDVHAYGNQQQRQYEYEAHNDPYGQQHPRHRGDGSDGGQGYSSGHAL